jgi:hypothetical protein
VAQLGSSDGKLTSLPHLTLESTTSSHPHPRPIINPISSHPFLCLCCSPPLHTEVLLWTSSLCSDDFDLSPSRLASSPSVATRVYSSHPVAIATLVISTGQNTISTEGNQLPAELSRPIYQGHVSPPNPVNSSPFGSTPAWHSLESTPPASV